MGAAVSLPRGGSASKGRPRHRRSMIPPEDRSFTLLQARVTKRLYEAIWEEARRDHRSFAAEVRYVITDFLRRRQEARRTEQQLR